jgi:hypothetical protein
MRVNILTGLTCLLAACAGAPVGSDSNAEPDVRPLVPDESCQEKTCLETIHLGPNHWVEFHQSDSGLTGIFEKSHEGNMVVKTPEEGVQVSLVDTYRALKPEATVPERLVAADARFQSMLRTLKEEAELATVRVHHEMDLHPEQARAIEQAARPVLPPEVPPSMSKPSRFYTAAEQTSFKQNQCVANDLQICYQGAGSWIDSGTSLRNVMWWKSYAMVGADSTSPGTFTINTYAGAANGWRRVFSNYMGQGAGVAAWIIPAVAQDGGIYAGHNARLDGFNGLASLGVGWSGVCGDVNQSICRNGVCQPSLVKSLGVCRAEACGDVDQPCCPTGPSCGNGTPGLTNDVSITCYNPVVGPKNCQKCGGLGEDCCGASQTCGGGTTGLTNNVNVTCFSPVIGANNCQHCGGDGEDCCGPQQACHVPGQVCGYVLFEGTICHTAPQSGGGGGGGCAPAKTVCGIATCPAGFHSSSFTLGCGATTGDGATVCVADCGPSYRTCDGFCATGYALQTSSFPDHSCELNTLSGTNTPPQTFTCVKQ